ncbi:MAG: hypothetical protein EOM26_13810 [Alphaproteobacteria bacterium]|nr:hypothetical protein [Alphaproteobacteria bacterium]
MTPALRPVTRWPKLRTGPARSALLLSCFSENQRDDHRDQSRQEALRVQGSIQGVLDEARVATETE